jgi:cytochrome c biogenesis protein CcmG, thiol:disulfide interchange protein DsbE
MIRKSETALIESQAIPEGLADEIAFARDPMFTGSETLSFGTDTVDCFVVRAKGRYRSGWSPDTKVDLTFWIDKSALTIRKIEEDWEGQLTMGDAARSKRTNTKVFPVVELADPHEPTDLFEFQIPPGAKLVTDFKLMSPPPMRQHPGLVGSMAPAVKFQSTDGHAVLLNSFRGKPVLIEFWATWWGPCVAALPKLERLYAEAQSHDIAVVTIDEDETADKATAYLTTHANPTWANYHDDGEINRAIPGEGLPEFVLIDAHGKIVFEKSGVDEHELRAAFAHLGFDLER